MRRENVLGNIRLLDGDLALCFVFFVFSLIVSFLYLSIHGVETSGANTTDSIAYYSLSKAYCHKPIEPVLEAIKNLNFIGLNWITIAAVGGAICNIFGDAYMQALLVFNCLLISLSVLAYLKISNDLMCGHVGKILFLLLFLCQTFLIPDITSLNKEVVSYFVYSIMLYAYIRNRSIFLVCFSIGAGLIKIQFLIIGLMLFVSLNGFSLGLMLLVISAALSVIYQFTDPAYLDAARFYARINQNQSVSTEGVLRFLSALSAYPFGYLLAMPAKVLVAFVSGLNFIPALSQSSPVSVLYHVNALFTSLIFFGASIRALTHRWELKGRIIKFLVICSSVIVILPYIQLRYFFPVFPVIVLYLISSPSKILLLDLSNRLAVRRMPGVIAWSLEETG